ncbi:MAG: RNA methyltransferase [Prevotella sp.]|nr:RNA methyltransferase [Prevotella sp.]
MSLSKNKIKYIQSFCNKKHRKKENAFIAEGFKCVGELLKEGFHAQLIVATPEWGGNKTLQGTEYIEITDEELRKCSLLQHPQEVIGIFDIPASYRIDTESTAAITKELCLCLDGVQDPGNLGTIIRTADWFGIKHIFCSHDTADIYNPKVVQATMGSIARIHTHYVDIPDMLRGLPVNTPVYGTLLDGENIYTQELSQNGLIVMGNEGNGISDEVRSLLTHRLLIPTFPQNKKTADSLNVSIATAIICSEFRRRS